MLCSADNQKHGVPQAKVRCKSGYLVCLTKQFSQKIFLQNSLWGRKNGADGITKGASFEVFNMSQSLGKPGKAAYSISWEGAHFMNFKGLIIKSLKHPIQHFNISKPPRESSI